MDAETEGKTMHYLSDLAAGMSLGEQVLAAAVALYAIPAFAVAVMTGLSGR